MDNKLKKILWTTNIPSPYRVDFFNELGKFCDLHVVFELSSSSERNQSWSNFKFENFEGTILNGIKIDVDKSFDPFVSFKVNFKGYDEIVISNPLTPTGLLLIATLKAKRVSYYIEGDGAIVKENDGIKKYVKEFSYKGAKGYFSTSIEHENYLTQYIGKNTHFYRYPFSSIKNTEVLPSIIDSVEKKSLRHKLGIYEEVIIISIGQFIYRKGFDLLLKISKNLEGNIGLYIIGGNPSSEYLDLAKDANIKVGFIPFQKKDKIREWLMASDIFVFPTREDIWGLVINEAMSVGLPIITTSKCMAGVEMIEDNVNGYVIPINDEHQLLEKIKLLLESSTLRSKMGMNNLTKARNYTIETMVEKHIEIFGL